MSEPAIRVDDLGRRYGARWAVRHLSFEVAPGEVLGFLGPNGAGKTTTVKMLTAQLRPTEGGARVDGLDVVADAARLGPRIGVTFEQQNLYERLTVHENLRFFAGLLGVSPTRIAEVLEEARLADRAGDVVGTLSKGLRQRLMLARALLGRPRVLFLDEPTSGLDPQAAETVQAWVARLAAEGTAVLLTTHDMQEAERLSARVAVIDQGTLRALEPPADLIRRLHPPRLHVRVRVGDAVREQALAAAPDQAARELAGLAAEGEVLDIREERATLGQAFLALTGHALDD